MQFTTAFTYDDLSRQAAEVVSDAVRAKPKLTLCLPTGQTPKGMYRELIRNYRERTVDFSRVSIFQLDEYVGLRADHPGSFRVYLWREFLNFVNVRRTNVFSVQENYEETIRNAGGIDLLVSGIGINGHIAFNEPGAACESRTRIVDLDDSTLEGIRQNFAEHELPRQALTVGISTILDARRVLLLASGTNKAAILRRALTDKPHAEMPASFLQLHRDVTVIADKDAASAYAPA